MTDLFYIDSSVAAHFVAQSSPAAVEWFNAVIEEGGVVASAQLLRVEVTRYLLRTGQSVADANLFLESLAITPVDNDLMLDAENISVYLKTLDTIHLAAALRLKPALTALVSDDQNLQRAAFELGLPIFNPLDRYHPSVTGYNN